MTRLTKTEVENISIACEELGYNTHIIGDDLAREGVNSRINKCFEELMEYKSVEEELGLSFEEMIKVLKILRNSNKQFNQTAIGTSYGLAIYFDINSQEEYDVLKEVLGNE